MHAARKPATRSRSTCAITGLFRGAGGVVQGRLTHVNVNYRYVDEELYYIFDNSDAKVVLYGSEFADNVAALKDRLPKVAICGGLR